MSALVTGARGFVGQALIRALVLGGEKVAALSFAGCDSTTTALSEESEVTWIAGDVRDKVSMLHALEESSPDSIYHLAAITFLPAAGSDPTNTFDTNTMGVVRLLSAIHEWRRHGSPGPRVLMVGSGEQYGAQPDDKYPLAEEVVQRPATIYAASKASQEMLGLQLAASFNLDVVATRSFNHSGRGQEPRFLLPGLVERANEAAITGAKNIPIGNTTPVRDFLHVSDVVRAYLALMGAGQPGEVYNVCSGKGSTVGELFELVLRIGGVDAMPARDEKLIRKIDVPRLVGDNTKLRGATGWAPLMSVEDVVADLWDACRHRGLLEGY